jgi:hypothetical protein
MVFDKLPHTSFEVINGDLDDLRFLERIVVVNTKK